MSRAVVWVDGKRAIKDTSTGKPVEMSLEQERAIMDATPAQIRLALLAVGRLDEVEALVALSPEASIVWEYATVIERLSPFIDSLNVGDPPPFTDEEVDDLFRLARTMT